MIPGCAPSIAPLNSRPRFSSRSFTVTTDAEAKVGDVVTVKGVLTTEKDFGAGYAYKAIVEKAQLSAK